ncbi:MAG: protein-L-isoaspartate O-methyltransferase [Campylobacterota bacterium]|nr:protein-L-isoaspartate O-methyltransferase [Campylobacterota bacterium]
MFYMNSDDLIQSIIKAKYLSTPQIIDAFKQIDRKYFVLDRYAHGIYFDKPLPIGYEQTISQPTTVAFMLELLAPQKGNKVLDIGSGSGWTTALLAYIVGEGGSVVGLERIEELVKFGSNNLKFLEISNAKIQKADDRLGVSDQTFDRILVSASASKIPKELFSQLKIGGRLVIPVAHSIYLFTKREDGSIDKSEFYGFSFVPLIY